MPAPSAASMGLPSWVDNPSQLKWDQSSVAMGTSPAKPGFDWLAAGAAAQDLFGGVFRPNPWHPGAAYPGWQAHVYRSTCKTKSKRALLILS
jgi:hypothetical protein